MPNEDWQRTDRSFEQRSTVKFQLKMRPAAVRIYSALFPGCKFQDLREAGGEVHILDKEFAIDALIVMPSGQWFSVQEKYRRNDALKYQDFTQEYMNAAGTQHESPGEWFKLGAQLYFYGWANIQETDFEKWLLMDVAKYKRIIENAGGPKSFKLRHNRAHGAASFFPVNLKTIWPAIVADYRRNWI